MHQLLQYDLQVGDWIKDFNDELWLCGKSRPGMQYLINPKTAHGYWASSSDEMVKGVYRSSDQYKLVPSIHSSHQRCLLLDILDIASSPVPSKYQELVSLRNQVEALTEENIRLKNIINGAANEANKIT